MADMDCLNISSSSFSSKVNCTLVISDNSNDDNNNQPEQKTNKKADK